MSHYKHLTLFEREMVMCFYHQGISITCIAEKLGRSKSTISRELRRNRDGDRYSASKAEEKYHNRRKLCVRKQKLSDADLFKFVAHKIFIEQWSPEQISNRLAFEESEMSISYATIYRAINRGQFDMFNGFPTCHVYYAARKLRHHGKRRHTKGYVENRGKFHVDRNITVRPAVVDERSRIGDWEGDTVVGKDGCACLVTLVDRKSRFLLCEKTLKRRKEHVGATLKNMLSNHPAITVTLDRGKEFAGYREIENELGDVEFYFALPYHPWQRGTNENTNGLLREYFPKMEPIDQLSDDYIQSCVTKLNLRPRKILNWRTPYEVYHSVKLHLT